MHTAIFTSKKCKFILRPHRRTYPGASRTLKLKILLAVCGGVIYFSTTALIDVACSSTTTTTIGITSNAAAPLFFFLFNFSFFALAEREKALREKTNCLRPRNELLQRAISSGPRGFSLFPLGFVFLAINARERGRGWLVRLFCSLRSGRVEHS